MTTFENFEGRSAYASGISDADLFPSAYCTLILFSKTRHKGNN